MPEYGYMGRPKKSIRTTQDHSGPPCDQIPYNIHRKLLHICHTLEDIQKKWDIPEFFHSGSVDRIAGRTYVLPHRNTTKERNDEHDQDTQGFNVP